MQPFPCALHASTLVPSSLLFSSGSTSRLRSSSAAPACLLFGKNLVTFTIFFHRTAFLLFDKNLVECTGRKTVGRIGGFLKSAEGVGMLSASGVASRCSLVWWRSSRVVPGRKQSSSTLLSSNNINNKHYYRRQTTRSNITVISASPVLTASMADAGPGAAASDSKSVNVVIKGSVQGVFYRKWTVEAAQKQGLNGWVRNLQDGSVEAVFAGPSKAVNDMIQQCHSGPSDAHVASVDISPWDHEVPQGFEKRKSS